MKRFLLVITFLFILGCSSQNVPVEEIELSISPYIEITNFVFNPVDVKIKTGDTVTWINQDNAPHNIVFDQGADISNSDTIVNGGTYSQKFEKPGVYLYHCGLHPSMKGRIIVE